MHFFMARRPVFSLMYLTAPCFEAEKYITGRKKYLTGRRIYLTGRKNYITGRKNGRKKKHSLDITSDDDARFGLDARGVVVRE